MKDIRELAKSTVSVGNAAESAVAADLVQQGYSLIDRNWRTKWCEVDIIAKKAGVVWFVEVKYRATTKFGDGLDYIGPQKFRHMQRAAELWTTIHGYQGEYTLSAVAVTGENVVGKLVEL
jgi:uncharacterized protein (TIGR00252 family)